MEKIEQKNVEQGLSSFIEVLREMVKSQTELEQMHLKLRNSCFTSLFQVIDETSSGFITLADICAFCAVDNIPAIASFFRIEEYEQLNVNQFTRKMTHEKVADFDESQKMSGREAAVFMVKFLQLLSRRSSKLNALRAVLSREDIEAIYTYFQSHFGTTKFTRENIGIILMDHEIGQTEIQTKVAEAFLSGEDELEIAQMFTCLQEAEEPEGHLIVSRMVEDGPTGDIIAQIENIEQIMKEKREQHTQRIRQIHNKSATSELPILPQTQIHEDPKRMPSYLQEQSANEPTYEKTFGKIKVSADVLIRLKQVEALSRAAITRSKRTFECRIIDALESCNASPKSSVNATQRLIHGIRAERRIPWYLSAKRRCL